MAQGAIDIPHEPGLQFFDGDTGDNLKIPLAL